MSRRGTGRPFFTEHEVRTRDNDERVPMSAKKLEGEPVGEYHLKERNKKTEEIGLLETSYVRLVEEFNAAVFGLEEIERTMEAERRKKSDDNLSQPGVLCGLLMAVGGALASPLTGGASLRLVKYGAGVAIGSVGCDFFSEVGKAIAKEKHFNKVNGILEKYRSRMLDFFVDLDREITKYSYNSWDLYTDTLKIFFSDGFIPFKKDELNIEHSRRVANGVHAFTKLAVDLSEQKTQISIAVATKGLAPNVVDINSAFLVKAMVELSKEKKIDVAYMVNMIKKVLENEMRAIDDIHAALQNMHNMRIDKRQMRIDKEKMLNQMRFFFK